MVDDTDAGAAAAARGHVTDGPTRCPTEDHFEESGRSLKVLVALCRGLKDDDGTFVLEPDSDPHWGRIRVAARRPTAHEWHAEISRRWETFVRARERPDPDDPRLGPRPKAWKLAKVLRWLDDNPIDAAEDVAFLRSTVARLEAEVEERARREEEGGEEEAEAGGTAAAAVDEKRTSAASEAEEAASEAIVDGGAVAVEKNKRRRVVAAVVDFERPRKECNGSSSSSSSSSSSNLRRKDAAIDRAPLSSLLPPPQLQSIVSAWLRDDVPSHFDVGGYVVGTGMRRAELWMKSPGALAGMPFFDAVFAACGGCVVRWEERAIEGAYYDVDEFGGRIKLATVTGPSSHLLRGERTALNSLSRCSGVATLSRECVRIARSRGWAGEVAGTRKTTPGFRLVEKYGLLVGGASTHRLDLGQMVMLKDNHVWSCGGSIGAAVKKARGACGFSQKIEVECQSLEEALIAAEAGADVVMLDNFAPDKLRADARAFKERYPHVKVEASGGITIETMADYFSEHVDVISQGALTQGYDCVDFSLKIVH
ncbi:hypothetical protein ACHAW5_007347 [Stephanodiscus triporus]|uniref:Nicotinate-nucleotide pyrophosphorylase [carboxylating] n=1 Tax=Stephanodiscus triporus TaxID=2934178 RepID=A0ABD3NFI6_9STRA